jgi:hypothetical protein
LAVLSDEAVSNDLAEKDYEALVEDFVKEADPEEMQDLIMTAKPDVIEKVV